MERVLSITVHDGVFNRTEVSGSGCPLARREIGNERVRRNCRTRDVEPVSRGPLCWIPMLENQARLDSQPRSLPLKLYCYERFTKSCIRKRHFSHHIIVCFDNSSVKIAAGAVLVSQRNWDCVLEGKKNKKEGDIGLSIQM